jgi:hypothetical protein
MSNPYFWVLYGLASVVVGIAGRERRMGFIGFFVLSLLFTPAIVLLVLIVTRPKPPSTTEE